MNQEIKQRWIEALRSGKYQQTQRTLACDEGMCCLGVLLDIEGRLGPVVEAEDEFHDGDEVTVRHNIRAEANNNDFGWVSFPSPEFLRSVQLSSEVASTLAELNDEGHDFNTIAEAIEKFA